MLPAAVAWTIVTNMARSGGCSMDYGPLPAVAAWTTITNMARSGGRSMHYKNQHGPAPAAAALTGLARVL